MIFFIFIIAVTKDNIFFSQLASETSHHLRSWTWTKTKASLYIICPTLSYAFSYHFVLVISANEMPDCITWFWTFTSLGQLEHKSSFLCILSSLKSKYCNLTLVLESLLQSKVTLLSEKSYYEAFRHKIWTNRL